MNKFIITFVILCSAALKVDSLQCYYCENCASVSDSDLITCGGTTTAAPTTTTATGGNTDTTTATPTTSVNTDTTTTAATPTTTPTTTSSTITESTPTTESTIIGDEIGNGNNILVSRLKRAAPNINERITLDYVCYSATFTANNTQVTNRGCSIVLNDAALPCVASAKNVVCSFCDADKCNANGANSLQTSILLMAIVSVLMYCKM